MANELALANMTFCWNSIIDRASWLLLSLTPQLQLAISRILCAPPATPFIYWGFFFLLFLLLRSCMSCFWCAFQMRCVRSNGYEGNMNVALCAKFLKEVGLLTALFKMNVSTVVNIVLGRVLETA